MTDAVQLNSVGKRFGARIALEDVTLTVGSGEYVTILGPSGSGKSTTLRVIAGLDWADSGSIAIRGNDVSNLPPDRRDCAMVFQNYALFPHLSVAENIAFGPTMSGASRRQAASRVGELLDLVGLGGQGTRRTWELSGGEQQRVAVARAMANEPAVLLLDEPLGALDFSLRRQMQAELRSIQRDTDRAFIHVTHDQGEALALSDRIAVLNEGRIAQIGSPADIYERPASRFVAEFMGFRNFLPIVIAGNGQVRVAGIDIALPAGTCQRDGRSVAAIRPERVRLGATVTGSAVTRGVVMSRSYAGSSWAHEIEAGDGTRIVANADLPISVGEAALISIDPEHVVILSG